MWHGVAELWALLSKDTFKRPLALSKCALTFADICEISLKLHRLQIHVKSSNERAVKWGEFLGFNIEGKLIQFTQDKQDCYIMSRR
jgi:RimJ/RimL family protein N-acetyltransferase